MSPQQLAAALAVRMAKMEIEISGLEQQLTQTATQLREVTEHRDLLKAELDIKE